MTELTAAVRARLAALAAEHGVPVAGEAALARFLALLAADAAAPTAVRDPVRAVELHVADALAGLAVPELSEATSIADLGAGAGVPALVLAAARPEALVFPVESAARKCAFLARAADAMGVANVGIVHARAEEWRAGLGAVRAVTARALAPLAVIAEYAAPLLAPGGVLVAWKAAPEPGEVAAGDAAAAELGLSAGQVVRVAPLPGAERRTLHVYLKVGSTPNRFPRRAGMARKRPLGGSTPG